MMMSHVLFQLLHQQYHDLELHVLAPAWSQALLSRMPAVHKTIVLPFGHGELKIRARYHFAKSLRAEKYHQAIVLPNSLKSALIPFWAKISKRTGWLGECRYGLLNDVRQLDKQRLPRMVDRFAALAFPAQTVLAANIPVPALHIQPVQVDVTLKKYALSQPTKPILILCPGAEFGAAKRWPAGHFAAVANQKISDGWDVWLLGSSNDHSVAQDIQAILQQRCINFAGKTTLAEAVDLLSLATVVVANDSGLMHIATAAGRPVIALYGSTSPEFTPPLSCCAKVLKLTLDCQPCCQRECPLKHHHCMQLLRPELVLNTINFLLMKQ